jgi:transcriptional regulator with XRE-family HTH domain
MGNVNAEDRAAMQRFGEKLRRLRMQRGMTVRELAVALGYSAKSNSYISETETGKRRPKIEFVLKVAQFFGVTMDQLTRDDIELDAVSDHPANTDDIP